MRGGSAESTIRNGASFGSGARPSRFRNAGSTARRRKRRNGCGTSCDASESASGTRSSTGSTPRGRTNRTSAPSARSGLSKEPGYDAGNPLPGRPIAVRVWPVPLRPELLAGGIEDPDRIRPREDVRADVQRLGPFRALPKGHAGNTEEARLLLEPARVREDESGVPLELEHVEVPRRRNHLYPRGLEKGVQPVLFRHLLGAGMDRKDDREPVAGGDRTPPSGPVWATAGRPGPTWATGFPSLFPRRAPARVVFVSPWTITRSAFAATDAACMAVRATWRCGGCSFSSSWTSGSRRAMSLKNTRSIIRS